MLNIFSNITIISGIGEKLSSFVARLIGGNRVIDLLLHKPSRIENKKFLPSLQEVENKDLIIVKTIVESHIKPATNRQPFKICCLSTSGYLTLTFFKTYPNYIEKNFPIGKKVVVSGIVEKFSGEIQMSHPEYVFPEDEINKIPKFEIIYPSIGALSQKFLRLKIVQALKTLPEIPEWIDSELLKKKKWPSFKEAILALHRGSEDQKRLVFDELLSSQLASLIVKKHLKNQNGRALTFNDDLRQKTLSILPFKLTYGQEKALKQIDLDLTSSQKMLRLLQGDVGSGKTIIAFLAMLLAVSNQKQAAILCPITLLAFQHYKTLKPLAEKIGINIEILTSKTTKKAKEKICEKLKNGQIDILIGTHSILEPGIIFQDLAIAIIDEQHRFGVMQRMRLAEKGKFTDVLLMSATPIPRSLMMTFYGNMDISLLNEKPQNRLEIDTRVISQSKETEVLAAISRALQNGEKIYWICPLIEESAVIAGDADAESPENNNPLSNVTARFEQFQKLFGIEKSSLIHGKMKDKEKEQIMNNFMSGGAKILVATTVIEVGIDVKDATVIIIENPENFGLSALHQLRGRVGRGEKKSFCILLYGKRLSQNGRKRLAIMKQSNDGFFIAEEDLKIRGSGKLTGTAQSGLPEYKIADLTTDLDLMKIAGKQAQMLMEKDLTEEEKAKLKILLRIFNYHECFKMVLGG
ncbi:MAG: ATP-dependent DNA helicase RecG [Lentimonas sp.]